MLLCCRLYVFAYKVALYVTNLFRNLISIIIIINILEVLYYYT